VHVEIRCVVQRIRKREWKTEVSSLETGITGSATAGARGKLIEAACALRSMLNTFGELERMAEVPPYVYVSHE